MNALRVGWIFFKVGAMNELQYRVNFFVQLFQSFIAVGTGLIGLWLVFSKTGSLDGWRVDELLVVLGIYTFMGGIIQTAIQPNMERLLGEIQEGTFDYALTKPEDAQLIASVREVRIWETVNILSGLVVLGVALTRLQSRVGVREAATFAFVLLLGGVMIYCFWLIITTIAFWAVRIDNVVNLFQGVYAAGRFPVSVYPGWLQAGLTFLVPIAFAVTVPSEALTGRLTLTTLLGAIALTVALFAASRWFWKLGLRHYSGASA